MESKHVLVGAAQRGDAKLCRLLLERGANVNVAKSDGETALTAAAGKGHAEVVELLLANQAKVDAAVLDGEQAIHKAARHGSVEVRYTFGFHNGGRTYAEARSPMPS